MYNTIFKVLLITAFTSSLSLADSCWDHNGSLMRLVAAGDQRWFYYEKPKATLRATGIKRGTLLFKGLKQNGHYIGTAYRYSKYCPDVPLKYGVEGLVRHNPLRIIMGGSRQIYKGCAQTGNYVDDLLGFVYKGDC